jgi:hypothetical protein
MGDAVSYKETWDFGSDTYFTLPLRTIIDYNLLCGAVTSSHL